MNLYLIIKWTNNWSIKRVTTKLTYSTPKRAMVTKTGHILTTAVHAAASPNSRFLLFGTICMGLSDGFLIRCVQVLGDPSHGTETPWCLKVYEGMSVTSVTRITPQFHQTVPCEIHRNQSLSILEAERVGTWLSECAPFSLLLTTCSMSKCFHHAILMVGSTFVFQNPSDTKTLKSISLENRWETTILWETYYDMIYMEPDFWNFVWALGKCIVYCARDTSNFLITVVTSCVRAPFVPLSNDVSIRSWGLVGLWHFWH
jgi:hypothetical protein